MRNIIIIGPPASGKLTIAKAVAEAKGYFLFDNHRSIDAVYVIQRDQNITLKNLGRCIRKAVFRAAVASDTPIIFTMVYGHPIDQEIMDEYVSIMTKKEPTLVVQLHCTVTEATTRCQDSSRLGTSKITEPNKIEALYSKYDLNTDYRASSEDVLHVDTSTISINESVRKILQRI